MTCESWCEAVIFIFCLLLLAYDFLQSLQNNWLPPHINSVYLFFFCSKAKLFPYNRPGSPKYLTSTWLLNDFDILLAWQVKYQNRLKSQENVKYYGDSSLTTIFRSSATIAESLMIKFNMLQELKHHELVNINSFEIFQLCTQILRFIKTFFRSSVRPLQM